MKARAIIGMLGVLAAAVPAGAAETVTVTISRADCRRLVQHTPAPDVAFRPGEDVYGRPVAPADLDASPLSVPDLYTIAITKDIVVENADPARPFRARVYVGRVRWEDGRVTFNGQPVTSEAQAELAARCAEILRAASRP